MLDDFETLNNLINRKENKIKNFFNIIENTLVFSSVDSRDVPSESGVSFRIDTKNFWSSVCKLFHIDRSFSSITLIPASEIKPDYLCVFKDKSDFIFTIIEMKGKHSQSHALKQIVHLKDIINTHIVKYFPNISRPYIQGLYLAPSLTQAPLEKIERLRKKGFIIVPLDYTQKFDIYDYVSKRLIGNEKYKHAPSKVKKFNYFETVLSYKSLLQERISNDFVDGLGYDHRSSNLITALDKEYCEYLIFYVNKKLRKIGYTNFAKNKRMLHRLKSELGKIGLTDYFSFFELNS